MTSITEIMEQKMKERKILDSNIKYTIAFNDGQPDNALPIVNTNGNYTHNNTYSNMDEYLNDNSVKKPKGVKLTRLLPKYQYCRKTSFCLNAIPKN